MGTKYTIEVEDKPFELLSEDGFTSEKLYRVKGFNSLVFDWNGLNMLTPYTEPDTEKVREEAFKNGYDAACKDIDIKSKINAAYRKGLDDAWECARKIVDCAIPYSVLENYLEIGECTADVIKHLPASKAIEVVRQYEQEKEELKKEQSVTAEDVMRQYLDTFCKGRSCTDCPLCTSDFTCGRGYHFLTATPVSDEEVRRAYAVVLQKMREE